MNQSKTDSSDWVARGRKNTLLLGYWTGAWLVTMALATFGSQLMWQSNRLLTALAILLNVGVGFGMILANKNSLRGLDELQQKIQLEAMALSLGVGLVVGLGYSVMDTSNLISFDAEISHLVILMGLTYAAGVFVGLRKYR